MDINQVISSLLREMPSLGVMLVMVLTFLRHLNRRDEIAKAVSDQCHEVQIQTAQAIRENVEALAKHNDAINDLAKVVERCRFTNIKTP